MQYASLNKAKFFLKLLNFTNKYNLSKDTWYLHCSLFNKKLRFNLYKENLEISVISEVFKNVLISR